MEKNNFDHALDYINLATGVVTVALAVKQINKIRKTRKAPKHIVFITVGKATADDVFTPVHNN